MKQFILTMMSFMLLCIGGIAMADEPLFGEGEEPGVDEMLTRDGLRCTYACICYWSYVSGPGGQTTDAEFEYAAADQAACSQVSSNINNHNIRVRVPGTGVVAGKGKYCEWTPVFCS